MDIDEIDYLVDLENGKLVFAYHKISLIIDNNKLSWFNSIDLCNMIDSDRSIYSMENLVDEEDKKSYKDLWFFDNNKIDKKVEKNDLFINEPGLYCMLIRSNTRKADFFRSWFTKEVLPKIRNFGFKEMIKMLESKKNVDIESTVEQNNKLLKKLDDKCNMYLETYGNDIQELKNKSSLINIDAWKLNEKFDNIVSQNSEILMKLHDS